MKSDFSDTVSSLVVVLPGVLSIFEYSFGLRTGITYDIHILWTSVDVGTVAVR